MVAQLISWWSRDQMERSKLSWFKGKEDWMKFKIILLLSTKMEDRLSQWGRYWMNLIVALCYVKMNIEEAFQPYLLCCLDAIKCNQFIKFPKVKVDSSEIEDLTYAVTFTLVNLIMEILKSYRSLTLGGSAIGRWSRDPDGFIGWRLHTGIGNTFCVHLNVNCRQVYT